MRRYCCSYIFNLTLSLKINISSWGGGWIGIGLQLGALFTNKIAYLFGANRKQKESGAKSEGDGKAK